MTTSRIVRGTKARIFLYICAVLIITGIIACYNNTLSQLEDARKSNEICHQQEENLSTQLQVISDYKQRLEKSLKTEKAEHQQLKNDLENKLNDERTKNEKAANESNLRFSSLQQHFNMLQTQYEDVQVKLKEVQNELKEVKASKESLKSKYLQLQSKNDELRLANENLQKQVEQQARDRGDGQSAINHLTTENHDLRKELDELKRKCPSYDSIQAPKLPIETSSSRNVPPVLKKQREKNPEETVESQNQIVASNQNYIKTPSRSTTTSSLKVSRGSLNGARPLLMPTVTPKTAKVGVPLPYQKKLPDGVVPVPEKREIEKKTDEEKNELPDDAINNRYRNKISDAAINDDAKKAEDADKDTGAREVFDHNAYDNFAFGDPNEMIKEGGKQSLNNKHHIDQLGVEGNKYENDENAPADDPEDDDPDYADHLGPQKDVVVRN